MFHRLLTIILVIFHTWLLSAVMSDYIQGYKQSLVLREAKKQAVEEQCSSVSFTVPAARNYLLAGMPGKYTRLPHIYLKSVLNTGFSSGKYSSDKSNVPGMWNESDDPKKHAVNSLTANDMQLSFNPESLDRSSQENLFDVLPHRSNKRTHSNLKEPLDSSHVEKSAKFFSPEMTDSRSGTFKSASLKAERQSPWKWMERRFSSFSARRLHRSLAKFTSEGNKHLGEGNEDFSGEVKEMNRPATELLHANIHDVPPKWMMALYFTQKEQLKVNPAAKVELPHSSFTLELWVKPEGGQSNPVLIAGWYCVLQ